jgi:hypothetical protein
MICVDGAVQSMGVLEIKNVERTACCVRWVCREHWAIKVWGVASVMLVGRGIFYCESSWTWAARELAAAALVAREAAPGLKECSRRMNRSLPCDARMHDASLVDPQ